MRRINSLLLLLSLTIVLIDVQTVTSNSQFCSTLHTTTKEDKCPNPSTFDILKEYAKSSSTWTLNIASLNRKTDQNILDEIKRRSNQGISCPYTRQTNKTICCKGWQGLACDQLDQSLGEESLASCHLWGQGHIRTFDGTYYQFPGRCAYKLTGAMTWQINIQFDNPKKITIVIGGKTLQIIGTKLTNVTGYPSSLTIRRQEKNLLDLHFNNGLRLKIDEIQRGILVQFDRNLLGDETISGLCGDFDKNPEDDLKLWSTGGITKVPTEFGNQWKLDRTCADVPPVVNDCAITPAVLEACRALTNNSDLFRSCFAKIDPKYFYQSCLTDVCSALGRKNSSSNTLCRALEAYAEECQEHNLHISWRSKTGCEKRCPSRNMVYSECIPLYLRTCQNPSSIITERHTPNTACTAGCICSSGTVYDGLADKCVPLEKCTCQFNGESYQAGDHITIDCNDCKCDHGRWSCTKRVCPRTCSILGDMNILTFDGKQYALVSPCEQVLVETSDASNYLRITYSHEKNELNIRLSDTTIIFRKNEVLINGNIRHGLPYQIGRVIIRRASTVFLEVRDISSSVVIHFDFLTSRIYVKLNPSFVNRVRGLCGTFNYITDDDFLTPNHLVETDLVGFANAYRASSCSIPEQQTDVCSNFPANERNARMECANLLKHPIFSTCSPLIVDPTFFLAACVRELCADQSVNHCDQVKCSMLTALAHACAVQGVMIDWMSNDTLAGVCQTMNYGQCGKGSQASYSECVSECRSTCTDIDGMPTSCINQCLPGCTCPSGQFYDEHSHVCRIRRECPCYESQSEQYIHPSQSLLIKSPRVQNCSCSDGSLQCSSFDDQQCDASQIYSSNATLCPRTCANHLSHFDCGLYGPGCTCPPGQVLLDSTSKCFPVDECPCHYNCQYYPANAAIIQNNHGCQNCTCQKGGIWSCKRIACSKTCTIFGHAHYQTFDGLYYKFPGQCQYILVKDTKKSFRILSQSIPCGSSGQICAKNLLIEYNGVTIDLVRGRPILFNDIELINYRAQPVTFGNVHIYQLGIYTVIKTDDFIVKWDEKTLLEVTIQSTMGVSGLCGNNNDNFDDDIQTANGGVQTSVYDMAKSWQTSPQCIPMGNETVTNDPCGDSNEHAQRRTWAQSKCDLIRMKSAVENNPFELCIEKMESRLIEKYYQACLYDACHADHGGDCEAVCTVLSAFAAECQEILKKPLPKWRTADRCPMQCESGKVYTSCGPSCPQSCFKGDDYDGCITGSGCVDGCFCPNGQVMDNLGQCVDRPHCPCLYQNNIYPQGSRIMMQQNDRCHQECECQNGTFICEKTAGKICITSNCTREQFTCQSDGQCIPLNWKCDGLKDCLDGSDELKGQCQNQCSNRTSQFQCTTGKCIDMTNRCDGVPDCRDGSDEMNCSYVVPCKEYQCPISKLCIPKSWICDGTVDCGQGDTSDESGDCKLHECDTLSGRYFQCRDNFKCLPIEQRCDAHKDCNDGSDEMNCLPVPCISSFSCLHNCQCIDSRRVCDGKSDCIDGTDEYNCTANCAKDEYTCLDGKCLARKFLCDEIRHCSKGEDETHPDCTVVTTTTTPMPTTTPQAISAKKTVSNGTEKVCSAQSALIDDQFISKPEFSTPIRGSISSLNPGAKGVNFLANNASTTVTIILPLKPNVRISELVQFQIPRPSNVNRFRLTFLNKQRKPLGPYKILSSNSNESSVSPTIEEFPLKANRLQEIRFIKVEILDTDDDLLPKRVTLLFEACFKKTEKTPEKTCAQVDAMDERYTARIIAKLGGTRPVNSTYGHLLKGYGGVTYNTSQAVIDLRFHKNIVSRIDQISIPDYALKRTNAKKIIVELFDRSHQRLFWNKTTTMQVQLNSRRKLRVKFIRISIVETTDDYAPFNVTVSVTGCFYQRYPKKKHTKKTTRPAKTTPQPVCYQANAIDPRYAHRIVGQFEGTQPTPGLSYLNFIEPSETGVNYPTQSAVLIIRFQTNVVGQLNEIALVNPKDNIGQFQIDLFDLDNNLLLSNQTRYSRKTIEIPSTLNNEPLYISTVQITFLNTIDGRPARGIILAIKGCYSTFPRIPTTTTPTTTTFAPITTTTAPPTTQPPRKCARLELMKNNRVVAGVTSKFPLTKGTLSHIGRNVSDGVTFSDLQPSIDIVFRSNILIYLSTISIISSTTNAKRFQIELLNSEDVAQYQIESSSLTVNFESLPSVVLAGIRITFLETTDGQPPKNIILSIEACIEEILIETTPATTTTTPAPITSGIPPTTELITPDQCADIDAMQQPYSRQILAGLSGTNPQGKNASLLDLISGKSVSFLDNSSIVIFIVFKPDLFVYLKSVGISSLKESNAKRIEIHYLDENHLLLQQILIDYSKELNSIEPIEGVSSLKITIIETIDGQPAKNIGLFVRGCFGRYPQTTTTTPSPPMISTTPGTPCHHLNLMSNRSTARQVIAYVAGTNPKSSSIFDYFNPSTSISYGNSSATLIIVFKRNVYAELKSISITNTKTNVKTYQIDLIDHDQTILQSYIIETNSSKAVFDIPIGALQITYLQTTDGQPPSNIILNIDGCFGINPNIPAEETTTTTQPPSLITTPHCREIDMMNKVDSVILIDSITGTLPITELQDYFNTTSSISYTAQASPITFLIILKSTVYAELQSIALVDSQTNVQRFRVDLIDDYQSIVQTIESNENLTIQGLTEVGIAAIRITYLETKDNQPPKNIRLAIRGCFGVLPKRRQTTPAITSKKTKTTKKPSRTTKHKCIVRDAMLKENRKKILQSISDNSSLALFSSEGLSYNSTSGSVALAFKPGVIGNMEQIAIIGGKHNLRKYRVIFYDIRNRMIGERAFWSDQDEIISIANVASIRIEFLETTDDKPIRNIKLVMRGCFFKIPHFKSPKTTTVKPGKPQGYCSLIDLMDERYTKRLLTRVGGTIDLPQIYNATDKVDQSKYFILKFQKNTFIRNIANITIRANTHQIEQIRVELHHRNGQLLKRMDLSMIEPIVDDNLYIPLYPIHVKYLKVTVLKGRVTENIKWSIVGCFDRVRRIKTIVKKLKLAWWTVSCVHSNILAGRYGYHRRKFLTPYITGTPLPIGEDFRSLLKKGDGISYAQTKAPIVIDIIFPPGIIGRLYEVGIRSSNVYRIRVQLVETPNGLLYTLTSPHYNNTKEKNTSPRLTGFPPVHSSGIRVILLDTIDNQPPRNVKIFTNGCFYRSSVKYAVLTTVRPKTKTTKRPKTKTTGKSVCRYTEWTRWRHCSVTCGNGVQTRARNRLSGSDCKDALMDYRMCQLQPCMCVLTKEFYVVATGRKVPANNIVGYLKDGEKAVHIGDILDTKTAVYAHDCLQFICSNVGLDVKKSKKCQHKCVYLPWSPWSKCQGHCGNKDRKGVQYRQRLPLRILSGSYVCPIKTENRSCQTSPCYGSCIVSSWSKWTPCSKTCGLGSQKRSRSYLSLQPNCTDKLEERRDCNPQCCPSKTKPTWSEWGPWGNCSQPCNGGERTRYRTCQTTPSDCQQEVTCKGSNKQIEPCNTGYCLTAFRVGCADGKVMHNCSNACGHTCNTLPCRSCNEPSTCVPGCVCPSPLVLNDLGECVETKQCLCQTSDGNTNLISGQRITNTQTCEDCLCTAGCLECRPSTQECSTCIWSEWSPYGVCSDHCNGTQTRYRSRTCMGSTPEFQYENHTCSTNETLYRKGCAQCSCDSLTGKESCQVQCTITPEICANQTSDPFSIYEYIPPPDGQCCGSCNRTNKTEPCAVQELPFEKVSFGDCVSKEPIGRQQCLGTCISGRICRCCSPSSTSTERIPMDCQRIENNTIITAIEWKSYAKILSCACEECKANH